MSLSDDRSLDLPSLSSTTSTLDSTVDEIVSDHAVSVIESWLHHFPAVHIPTDDDFKALATLTRLKVETVRMWFGQRLRRQLTASLGISSSSVAQERLPDMNVSVMQTPSEHVFTQSIAHGVNAAGNQAVLREAAGWVRERGTKCNLTLEPELLQRYEPRPYQCTLGCGKNFDKRADWKKHEEINHPQEGWLCLQTSCNDKSMSHPGKISYRKDKFKQHYTNAHRGINCETHCDGSHFLVSSRFPRRCGFCITHRFSNWEDRITHVGDHFFNDRYDMTRWRVIADDEETNKDDPSNEGDDGGFDEGQNNQNDGSDRDFDWHDNDNGDDAFSDSEDDSDDSPPGSASRQRAQFSSAKSCTQNTPIAIVSGSLEGSSVREEAIRSINWMTTSKSSLSSLEIYEDTKVRPQDDKICIVFKKVVRHRGGCFRLPLPPSQTMFTRIRILGIGPYSIVDEVEDWRTGRTFARKTVHYTTQRTFKALKTEVEIMKQLNHPHIVRFVGEYTTDHSLSILMTPSADFDLDYLMATDPNNVDTQTVSKWFSCLISSVDYLHSHSIKHQDIKPSNILIRGDTIFLADFGVAKTFNEFDSTTSTSGNMTRKYCSPETAHYGYRGRKADIFSLGCVFLEMLNFLIQDDDTSFLDYQWKNFVGDGIFHENLDTIKAWLELLLAKAGTQSAELDLSKVVTSCKKMMEIDPRDRPSIKELAIVLAPGVCCDRSVNSKGSQANQRHEGYVTPAVAHEQLSTCLEEEFGLETKTKPSSINTSSLIKYWSNNSCLASEHWGVYPYLREIYLREMLPASTLYISEALVNEMYIYTLLGMVQHIKLDDTAATTFNEDQVHFKLAVSMDTIVLAFDRGHAGFRCREKSCTGKSLIRKPSDRSIGLRNGSTLPFLLFPDDFINGMGPKLNGNTTNTPRSSSDNDQKRSAGVNQRGNSRRAKPTPFSKLINTLSINHPTDEYATFSLNSTKLVAPVAPSLTARDATPRPESSTNTFTASIVTTTTTQSTRPQSCKSPALIETL